MLVILFLIYSLLKQKQKIYFLVLVHEIDKNFNALNVYEFT